MLTGELEYDEDLIGESVWWSDLRVEVTDLADEPAEPAVYLMDARAGLSLGSVHLSSLTEAPPTPFEKGKSLVFSESLVGKIVYWSTEEVRIASIKTYPSKGKVHIRTLIGPHYQALVNVADLSRHRKEPGQRVVTPAAESSTGGSADDGPIRDIRDRRLGVLEVQAFRLANELKDMASALASLRGLAPPNATTSIFDSDNDSE